MVFENDDMVFLQIKFDIIYFQFSESEVMVGMNVVVVFDGWVLYNGFQFVDGLGSDGGGFGLMGGVF